MINRAAEKNITIETNIGNGIPEMYLDPKLTGRILNHLIDNAIKFSREYDVIKVNLYNKKSELVIEVIDQGIGLNDADKEAIFDLFVQKDMNLNRIYGGVGLGLTIVKNLTELQNGRVHVKSSVGEGSCFSVCFTNSGAEAAIGEDISQIA
jgi:signal transduction histidine kinase